MADDLPASLAQLVERLLERGFAVVVDEEDESEFRNRLLELRAPGRAAGSAIRLVRDRGVWDVAIDVGGEWVGTHSVLLALDDAPFSTRAESHAERCATTLAVVDRLPEEKERLNVIKRRLADYRREYWKRFGVLAAE